MGYWLDIPCGWALYMYILRQIERQTERAREREREKYEDFIHKGFSRPGSVPYPWDLMGISVCGK